MKQKKIIYLLLTLTLLLSSIGHVDVVSAAEEQPLKITMENIVLDRQNDDILAVRGMIAMKNNSKDDIVSTLDNPLIKFQLPANATRAEVSMQDVELQYEVVDRDIVLVYELPAERSMELSISYFIDTNQTEIDFSMGREYLTKAFSIYVPSDAGLTLKSSRLSDSGATSMGQRTFNFYTAADIAAGELLDIKIAKGEREETVSSNNRINQNYDGFHNPGHIRFWENSPFKNFDPHLLTFVFVVLILFSIGYYFYRWHIEEKKVKELQKTQEDDIFMRLYKEETVLKKKLAELQIMYDDGKIDEEEFQKRREIYKKKLINVKLKIKEFTD